MSRANIYVLLKIMQTRCNSREQAQKDTMEHGPAVNINVTTALIKRNRYEAKNVLPEH